MCRKTMEHHPNQPLNHINISTIYHELKQYTETETAHKKAIQLNSKNSNFLNSLAWLLYSAHADIEDAEQTANHLYAGGPNVGDDLYMLPLFNTIFMAGVTLKE